MLTINRLNMIGFRGRRDRPGAAIDNDGGTVTITNSNFALQRRRRGAVRSAMITAAR